MCGWIFSLGNLQIYAEEINKEELPKKSYQLAAEGKVLNSDFSIGTLETEVYAEWGYPDLIEDMGWLAAYEDDHVSLTFDQGELVSIDSYDPNFLDMQLSEVLRFLGEPQKTTDYQSPEEGNIKELSYNTGDYSLNFQFHHIGEQDPFITRVTVLKKE
jgi:Domain of unknown function (DUF4309)